MGQKVMRGKCSCRSSLWSFLRPPTSVDMGCDLSRYAGVTSSLGGKQRLLESDPPHVYKHTHTHTHTSSPPPSPAHLMTFSTRTSVSPSTMTVSGLSLVSSTRSHTWNSLSSSGRYCSTGHHMTRHMIHHMTHHMTHYMIHHMTHHMTGHMTHQKLAVYGLTFVEENLPPSVCAFTMVNSKLSVSARPRINRHQATRPSHNCHMTYQDWVRRGRQLEECLTLE